MENYPNKAGPSATVRDLTEPGWRERENARDAAFKAVIPMVESGGDLGSLTPHQALPTVQSLHDEIARLNRHIELRERYVADLETEVGRLTRKG